MKHYVCDACGNLWSAATARECPACRHGNLWEFPPDAEDHAAQHATLVREVREKATA